MELPQAVRGIVDRLLEETALSTLSDAAEVLSTRYRGEVRDGRLHLDDDLAARAYIATRLPATYAAVSACTAAIAGSRPDFAPRTLLDVGAGPGSVLLAAAERWPGLERALLLEASPAIRVWGERLTAQTQVDVSWRTADATAGLAEVKPHDLVSAAYVLNELSEEAREKLVADLWANTTDTLLLVEPGTPAGYRRILAARAQLLGAGAHPVAPCPHAQECPLIPPDWCHFSQRTPRSRLHRGAKRAEVGWEDEKYSYAAVSRVDEKKRPGRGEARVLATPRARSGLVTLKLCEPDGSVQDRRVSKREGEVFRAARRIGWGDTF